MPKEVHDRQRDQRNDDQVPERKSRTIERDQKEPINAKQQEQRNRGIETKMSRVWDRYDGNETALDPYCLTLEQDFIAESRTSPFERSPSRQVGHYPVIQEIIVWT